MRANKLERKRTFDCRYRRIEIIRVNHASYNDLPIEYKYNIKYAQWKSYERGKLKD